MDVRFEENVKEIVEYVNKNGATNEFLTILLRKMWNEAIETGMNREYETQKSRRTEEATR